MAAKFTFPAFAFLAVVLCLMNINHAEANPAIAAAYEPLQICMENCAQCKKMFGPWFEGPRCVEYCFKYRGKVIPECEDIGSIAPFINKL